MAKKKADCSGAEPLDLSRSPFASEGRAAMALRTLLFALEQGRRPHEADLAEVVAALKRYDEAEVGTVGEAFGFPWNKNLSARRAERLAGKIAWMVFQVQADAKANGKTIPLNSNRDHDGALEIVGRMLNPPMAPATVKKYRDAWLRFCKKLGVEPPGPRAIPRTAAATSVVFQALAVQFVPATKLRKE